MEKNTIRKMEFEINKYKQSLDQLFLSFHIFKFSFIKQDIKIFRKLLEEGCYLLAKQENEK